MTNTGNNSTINSHDKDRSSSPYNFKQTTYKKQMADGVNDTETRQKQQHLATQQLRQFEKGLRALDEEEQRYQPDRREKLKYEVNNVVDDMIHNEFDYNGDNAYANNDPDPFDDE